MPSVIEVKCIGCGKTFKVKSEFTGKKAKCPVCGKVITIRDPGEKGESLMVNEDVSDEDVRKVARAIADGPGMKKPKKRSLLARIFGKK